MNYHELKTWPEYFEAVKDGSKRFEARKNDRDYQSGDAVRLREYDPEKQEYTGRDMFRRIGYVLHGGGFGLEEGYVVFSLGGLKNMFSTSMDFCCLCCSPDFAGFPACSKCGNKRCPHATWHGNECSGSNAPGQDGSDY